MGKMSRRKGASFERLVANRLKQIWGPAKRGIGQARSAGEVADVEGTPYWLELKHRKLVNIRAAMRQAVEQTDGRAPVVVSRSNGEDVLVTMRLDDWLEVQSLAEQARKVMRTVKAIVGPDDDDITMGGNPVRACPD